MKNSQIVTLWLGEISYQSARDFIRTELFPLATKGKSFLVFCKHPKTITFGKNMSDAEKNIVRFGFENDEVKPQFVDTDRGGKATFHDLNQLMIYPIFHLPSFNFGLKTFIQNVLQSVSEALGKLGISCVYDDDLRGLWVGKAKLGSVGFRLVDKISEHGVSLYLTKVGSEFNNFSPCGDSGLIFTSIEEQSNSKSINLNLIISLISDCFRAKF